MPAGPTSIRRARPRDAPALAELAASTFRESHGAFLDADEAIEIHVARHFGVESVASWITDPAGTLLVAAHGGRLSGYVQLKDSPPPACVTGPAPIELARIYLAARSIGTGLGARLMRAACAEARALQRRTVWLVVCEGNLRAIGFYGRFGFVPVGSTVFMLGDRRYVDPVMAAPVPEGA